MEMQLIRIFKIILLFISIIDVKGQKYSQIDFFDKKYKTSYSLDANIQMPIKSFYSSKIGEFTIYYIAKNDELKKSWYNFDLKNGLSYEEAPDEEYLDKLDKLIANKLNKKENLYTIYAVFITPKYISIKNDEVIYKFPLLKKIYKYDRIKKKWSFIKVCNIYSDNENTLNIDFFSSL